MIDPAAKTTKVAAAAMILLLLYAVFINVEHSNESHRYTVVTQQIDGSVKTFECLTMIDGITKEMELKRVPEVSGLEREKMWLLTKWYKCGVL